MFCNYLRESPVTILEIRNKVNNAKCITEKKKQIIDQQYKMIDGEKIFPSVMEFWCTVNGWWYQKY